MASIIAGAIVLPLEGGMTGRAAPHLPHRLSLAVPCLVPPFMPDVESRPLVYYFSFLEVPTGVLSPRCEL